MQQESLMAANHPLDITANKRTLLNHANPAWRKIVASKSPSRTSIDADSHVHSHYCSNMARKQENILDELPWPTYTTQTSVSADAKTQHHLIAPTGTHRRLCFSLDEKALFDLHHPQYSSTASQQQSSEQSPQRTVLEPIKPPFEPPERVRTPDGVPSWPGVMETCTDAAHRGQLYQERPGLRRRLSNLIVRPLKKHRGDRNGKRARILRAFGFKPPRQEQRPVAPWRPPISGHSTFRFSA
jgi:hypothetical protein